MALEIAFPLGGSLDCLHLEFHIREFGQWVAVIVDRLFGAHLLAAVAADALLIVVDRRLAVFLEVDCAALDGAAPDANAAAHAFLRVDPGALRKQAAERAELFDFALVALSFSVFDAVQKVLLYAFATFAVLLLCCGLVFLLNLCSTYKMSLFTAVKNSFLLAVKYFWKTLGVLCITVLPLVVLCIVGSVWMWLVVYLLLAVFGFVHTAEVWHLFTNSVFDNHINRQNYPDFYRKGLAPIDVTGSGKSGDNGEKSSGDRSGDSGNDGNEASEPTEVK